MRGRSFQITAIVALLFAVYECAFCVPMHALAHEHDESHHSADDHGAPRDGHECDHCDGHSHDVTPRTPRKSGELVLIAPALFEDSWVNVEPGLARDVPSYEHSPPLRSLRSIRTTVLLN